MRVFPLPPPPLEAGGGVLPFLGKWVCSDFLSRTIDMALGWDEQSLQRHINGLDEHGSNDSVSF